MTLWPQTRSLSARRPMSESIHYSCTWNNSHVLRLRTHVPCVEPCDVLSFCQWVDHTYLCCKKGRDMCAVYT